MGPVGIPRRDEATKGDRSTVSRVRGGERRGGACAPC